jgi:hypothetical protein
MTQDPLPAGFSGLKSFVSDWVLPDAIARKQMRRENLIGTIKRATPSRQICQKHGQRSAAQPFPDN